MTIADKIRQAAKAHLGDRSLLYWIRMDYNRDDATDAYVADCRRISEEAGLNPDDELLINMQTEAVHDLIREAWIYSSSGLYRFQVKTKWPWVR